MVNQTHEDHLALGAILLLCNEHVTLLMPAP